jgi:hypothetical protein
MAGEIISESVGGIIPERRAASPGIGKFRILASGRRSVLGAFDPDLRITQ